LDENSNRLITTFDEVPLWSPKQSLT
jgi:hypothetical protein